MGAKQTDHTIISKDALDGLVASISSEFKNSTDISGVVAKAKEVLMPYFTDFETYVNQEITKLGNLYLQVIMPIWRSTLSLCENLNLGLPDNKEEKIDIGLAIQSYKRKLDGGEINLGNFSAEFTEFLRLIRLIGESYNSELIRAGEIMAENSVSIVQQMSEDGTHMVWSSYRNGQSYSIGGQQFDENGNPAGRNTFELRPEYKRAIENMQQSLEIRDYAEIAKNGIAYKAAVKLNLISKEIHTKVSGFLEHFVAIEQGINSLLGNYVNDLLKLFQEMPFVNLSSATEALEEGLDKLKNPESHYMYNYVREGKYTMPELVGHIIGDAIKNAFRYRHQFEPESKTCGEAVFVVQSGGSGDNIRVNIYDKTEYVSFIRDLKNPTPSLG